VSDYTVEIDSHSQVGAKGPSHLELVRLGGARVATARDSRFGRSEAVLRSSLGASQGSGCPPGSGQGQDRRSGLPVRRGTRLPPGPCRRWSAAGPLAQRRTHRSGPAWSSLAIHTEASQRNPIPEGSGASCPRRPSCLRRGAATAARARPPLEDRRQHHHQHPEWEDPLPPGDDPLPQDAGRDERGGSGSIFLRADGQRGVEPMRRGGV